MNRVARLARMLQLKHGLSCYATPQVVAEVKRDILDAYRHYFSRIARDSMFQYAADLGHPGAMELTKKMDYLVKNIDQLTSTKLMHALNNLLALMYNIKHDPDKSIRQAIHDSIPGSTEAQRNTRQRLLSKYERSISMAFPALQKAALKLQTVLPDVPVHGGKVERQRAELSKQQLVNFVLSAPAFKNFGVDSLEVMEQVLSDPDLKHRLTTLINAVNRGLAPLDGPAIQEFAARVKQRLEQHSQSNQPFLDSNQPLPSPQKPEEDE